MQTSHTIHVNDIHSQLNETPVRKIIEIDSLAALQAALAQAAATNTAVSIAGGRHAMGGQQFGADTLLLDMRPLNRVLSFDREHGHIEVEAGIQWPALVEYLIEAQHAESQPVETQNGTQQQWSIVQKQTGADRLTLGGAVSANVHGRGLAFRPIIQDIESLQLVDAGGNLHTCSRTKNRDLFRLAIGGYGLFGVIYSIKLRLMLRQKVQRHIEITTVDKAIDILHTQRDAGVLYGDFQFAIDENSPDFLYRGLVATYKTIAHDIPVQAAQQELGDEDWARLTLLAHTDKAQAYAHYTGHYLATHGQVYWSDTHQLSPYFDGYHAQIDQMLGAAVRGSEMITELYVPRPALTDFMAAAATYLRTHNASVIYGTVRLIERDDESFLAWAKQDYACIVLNLHVDHSPAGIERAMQVFRGLIDLAIERHGSFFLTYHKWARRTQIEACYPEFSDFLAQKRRYDPDERFQSDWYCHYQPMFAAEIHAE